MHGPPVQRSDHVVILALDTLGDLVLRQPLFSELLDRNYAVTVVVRSGYEEIVPHLDARLRLLTIRIDPHKLPTTDAWQQLTTLAAEIAVLGPEFLIAAAHNRTYADEWILHQFPDCESVGFDLPYSPLDHLPADVRPGGSRRAELLSRAVKCAIDDHEATKSRALFAAIAGTEMPERMPRIVLDDRQLETAAGMARALGLEPGRYVFGCPMGTVTLPLKAWPVHQFVEIAARLWMQHALPTLLAGVPSESCQLHEMADAGGARGLPLPVWIGEPGSMAILLGLIAHSRLYLGNDTGPMHCAGALGVPVVARFGGGHWPRFLPLARRSFVATQQLPCFGCAWRCWLDAPACMTTIAADTFVEAADWALSSEDADRRVDVGKPLDGVAAETLIAAAGVTTRLKAELDAARLQSNVPPVRGVGSRPKVFVVTPSFNQGRYLRDTIESVLRQDYDSLDYFVSDGGSTDETLDILRSYGDRVRWRSGPDGGQAAAIARAWADADAEILAWLNSDDTYLDGAISMAVDYLLAHPEAAMVYGQAWYTNAVGRRLGPYPTRSFDRNALASECFICQPAAFVRREVFQIVDLPDASLRYCMDYDLWIRISRHFQVGFLSQFLATSRLHMETKTLAESDGASREAMHVSRRHFGSASPQWALLYARYRVGRISERLSVLGGPFRRWVSSYMAMRLANRVEAPPYSDGWAGPRTVIEFERSESARAGMDVASVEIDFPVWPYRGLLRITASCEGRVLAIRHVRGSSHVTLIFRLPDPSSPTTSVLLTASRAFVPAQQFDWLTDLRIVSFRILQAQTRSAARAEDLALPDRLARVSHRLRFLPLVMRRTVCGMIARLSERPVECTPDEQGWVGRRTEVAVHPDEDGRVTLDCDRPFWPHKTPLRISVEYEGRVVAVRTVDRARFALTFTVPARPGNRATVLLIANLSFAPRDHGLAPDPRLLSFRILDGVLPLPAADAGHPGVPSL